MRYRAAVFDLFGTLVHISSTEESETVLADMASILAVSVSDFTRLWYATGDDRMRGLFPSYKACVAAVCERLGSAATHNQIDMAAEKRLAMARNEMTPYEGAKQLLSRLKSDGCRIGLISNMSMEAVHNWRSSPLAKLVDAEVISCLEGTKKPDPRMFKLACERLGVKAGECLYIADGMDSELEAAAAAGMRSILIRRPGASIPYIALDAWNGPTIVSLEQVSKFL